MEKKFVQGYIAEKELEEYVRVLNKKNYTYISTIGRGGAAAVLLVWDRQKGRLWACKIGDDRRTMQKEGELLGQISHPLFPDYEDSWVCGGRNYLLMEYVPGSNVKELVERRGCLSEREAVYIARKLAEGLLFLHQRSEPVLFRDIKPENVMLRQDGSVKLVDMGCACIKGQDRSIGGSLGYSAPEQFKQNQSVSEESDVYALGKLLAFMLGKHKISPGVKLLIKQSTQWEPDKRIPDMWEFLYVLSECSEREGLIKVCFDFKYYARYLFGRRMTEYYYIKNIRRGL